MPKGTSWTVRGTAPPTDGYRIRLALERGDIRWEERCEEWLLQFDRSRCSKSAVNRMLWDHVRNGGLVTGQRNAPGEDFEVFFYVEIEIEGRLRFIKFVIEPEEDDNPGLIVISTHDANR